MLTPLPGRETGRHCCVEQPRTVEVYLDTQPSRFGGDLRKLLQGEDFAAGDVVGVLQAQELRAGEVDVLGTNRRP